jgi:hypothetical protein
MRSYFILVIACLILPFLVQGQVDTNSKHVADTTVKPVDTAKKMADTAGVAKVPQNCYTKWYDYMSTHGAKAVADGMQQVVIAVRSGESCHCYMGKIEIAGGRIKAPLYIQEESGQYKTSAELGKKLDPEFVTTMGADLWKIVDGMSSLFRTTDQEYGRLFFYEFANKQGGVKKEAPSPEELMSKP